MLVFIIRALFFLAMAAAGYVFGDALGTRPESGGWQLFGMVAFTVAAAAIIVLDMLFRRKDIALISAVFFGLIVGLVVSMLMTHVLDMYPELKELRRPLQVLISVVASYLAISLILQTRSDFRFVIPYVEFTKQQKGGRPMLLDTSVIIDGRIADIADTLFFDAPMIVPQFILHELQSIADSADRLKRDRGRRGLDILNRLQSIPNLDITIQDVSVEAAPGDGADQKLVALASKCSGRIVTIDYNLNKVAKLAGVEVLNINDLANALKPAALPGEQLEVTVLKPGQEEGQGVGYLEDGTMVVVEDGGGKVGQTVTITVTNVLQKSAGRMIFGRTDAGTSGGRSRAGR